VLPPNDFKPCILRGSVSANGGVEGSSGLITGVKAIGAAIDGFLFAIRGIELLEQAAGREGLGGRDRGSGRARDETALNGGEVSGVNAEAGGLAGTSKGDLTCGRRRSGLIREGERIWGRS